MVRVPHLVVILALSGLLLAACQAEPLPVAADNAVQLRFSGDKALHTETEFVQAFPNRHSGQPSNHAAANWFDERLSRAGLACTIDRWDVVHFSRPVALNNVVCRLPGESEKEILLVAHLDQAPTTIQGADNDGSGIAILLQLAEIFASEPKPRYTLTFAATDAEEYGMVGSGRYIQTHPNRDNIMAGMSLDNLGRTYYDAMNLELIGQFRSYGPIWLALQAREAARSAGTSWTVNLRSPLDQVTDQAAPVSFMDQGPMVAAGVPALGFAGHVPTAVTDEHFHLWHNPDDTLDHQSASSLEKSGRIAEAFTRQLQGMSSFPSETGPYVYLDDTHQVLRGLPLWLIFLAFVAVFFLGSVVVAGGSAREILEGWRRALPHFLRLWLPLLASIVLLYVLVAIGLMDTYARYPAVIKDPRLTYPRWPAVIVFLGGVAGFLYAAGRLEHRGASRRVAPGSRDIKSLSLLVIGLAGAFIIASNPFSLLFLVPALFWLLIGEARGVRGVLNIIWFLLGGLVVYGLLYVFGFLVLRLNFSFLWYLMNMFSTRMISFAGAMVITMIIAAGLAMIVSVPIPPRAESAE